MSRDMDASIIDRRIVHIMTERGFPLSHDYQVYRVRDVSGTLPFRRLKIGFRERIGVSRKSREFGIRLLRQCSEADHDILRLMI